MSPRLAGDGLSAVIASMRGLEPYIESPAAGDSGPRLAIDRRLPIADRGVSTKESREKLLKVCSFHIIFHGR
jgi:hypothetical protein